MAAIHEDLSGTFTINIGDDQTVYVDSVTVQEPQEMPPIYTASNGTADFNPDLLHYYVGEDNQIHSVQEEQANFRILSPDEAALSDMVSRVREFYQWLKEEQEDLEEECGADLGGLVDKIEEIFPELSGEADNMPVLSPTVSPFFDGRRTPMPIM